ncbi:MAG: hypothetical protein JSS83_25950 [Cyanobacteria bacterium SZAS LIN-3]|nr:hypothetical protein [Cyanobacteria bacterium SZAS LIN-3]
MTKTPNRRCIYCTKTLAAERFNSEHVIQECMTEGAGIQEILTLEPTKHSVCVCKTCNTDLGKMLDEPFGRDSIEGFLRFVKGKKKKKAIENQHWKRVKLKSKGDGILSLGTESKMLFDGKDMFTRPSSQIQIQNIASGELESFEEKNFQQLVERQHEFDFSSLTVTATENLTEVEWKALKEKVANLITGLGKKIESASETKLIGGIEEPVVNATYDTVLLRAIAKIAFNYMAFVFNETTPEVMFAPGMDAIRAFIKDGTEPTFVAVERVDEDLSTIPTMSHSVRLQCAFNETMIASARVCLFNQIVWQVILSPNLEEVVSTVQRAHLWCFDSERCYQLY